MTGKERENVVPGRLSPESNRTRAPLREVTVWMELLGLKRQFTVSPRSMRV